MSVELLIGTGHEDESHRNLIWDTKFGTASWVAQQVQQRVTDTGLKVSLQPYIDERHFFVDFGTFPETQTTQVVGVILGALLPAARHEWPPDNDPFLMVQHIEDLVTSTRAWLDELNAWRRAQGRTEFAPTRVPEDVPKPDPTRLLMTDSIYLAAFWGARPDTAKTSARTSPPRSPASARSTRRWRAGPSASGQPMESRIGSTRRKNA